MGGHYWIVYGKLHITEQDMESTEAISNNTVEKMGLRKFISQMHWAALRRRSTSVIGRIKKDFLSIYS